MLGLWAAFALFLSLEPFERHIEYFAKPGPHFRTAILALLAAMAFWTPFYVWIRARGLWRWEPRLLVGVGLAIVAVREPLGLAVILLLGSSCYATGSALLERLGIDPGSAAARLAVRTGFGMGALIVVLIPIGLAGLYGPWTFGLLFGGTCVALRSRLREVWRELTAIDATWRESIALASPLVGAATAFAPLFLAALLLDVLSPVIAYDAISHHLPAAQHYLLGGVLEPLPIPPGSFGGKGLFYTGHAAAYSYYPQSFELLLTAGIGLGGQAAARLITPLFMLLSLLTVVAIARLCGLSRRACVVGAAGAACLPFAHWTGAIVKNDYPLAFFELAALYAVLKARRAESDSAQPERWMLAAACFLGWSFGVKHVALFGALGIGALMLELLRRRPRPVRWALILAAAFALSGLFWHARTYALTGNPIYPAGARHATTALAAVDGSNPPRWQAYWTYPWLAHFRGQTVIESPTQNPLGFYFVFFAAAWLLARRRRSSAAERACWVFLAVYYVYWVYVWGVLRYGLAPILVLALLAGGRIDAVASGGGRASRWILSGLLATALAFALLPTLILEVNAYELPYVLGRMDRDEYLRTTLRDYPAVAFLNSRMGPEDHALGVNNCAAAYAVDPARFRCVRWPGSVPDGVVEWTAGVVEGAAPRYLVLPRTERGRAIGAAVRGAGYGEAIYQDEAFEVRERAEGAR